MTNQPAGATSELLRVVGNETRRRILSLLSSEPHYILQLSQKLNVTQPAILKHLDILEKTGLIESFATKSTRGADRKYYKIKDNINLEIIIEPATFKVKRHLQKKCQKYQESRTKIERITIEINQAQDINAKATKARELIAETDTLLTCTDNPENSEECAECHRIASLKRGASEIILQVSSGNAAKGLRMLSEMLKQLT